MTYGYYNYYTQPMVNYGLISLIVAAAAALVGVILFFTFLRRKNEDRLRGVGKKIYDYFNFNRFYTEDLMKLLYIVTALVLTALGITYIVMGRFVLGISMLVGGNIAARVLYELIIVTMVITRRIVSVDRRVSRIEKFYEDDYSDWECGQDDGVELDIDEDDFQCSGACESCASECSPEFKEAHGTEQEKDYRDYNREYKPSVIYAGHVEKEKLSAPERDEDPVTPDFCKGCSEWDSVSSDCYAEKCIREAAEEQAESAVQPEADKDAADISESIQEEIAQDTVTEATETEDGKSEL